MMRRLAVTLRLLPVLTCLALAAGCGGDAEVGFRSAPPTAPPGPAVSGTVKGPNGSVALAEAHLLQRLASLIIEEAAALTGSNIVPVPAGVTVNVVLLDSTGHSTQSGGSTTTNANGQYLINLPSNTSEDTPCRFLASAGVTRAFVYSTSEPVDIDFISDATVSLILGEVAGSNHVDLCAYTLQDIRDLLARIRAIPGVVTGTTATQVNSQALTIAAQDPEVQAILERPLNLTPTETPQPSATFTVTSTPTNTVPATPTFTRLPTNTPTTGSTSTPTVTAAQPTSTITPTVMPPSPTVTATVRPTDTATVAPSDTATPTQTTIPSDTATATQTTVPTDTATPTNTLVNTDTPTQTPTSTPQAPTDTPTDTPTVAQGPHITIGDACGAAGSQVTVMISLTNNGANIVTVAPLVIGFDVNALTFVSCVAAPAVVPAKSLSPPGTSVPGQLALLLSGDLSVIPDGDIINCTFAINAAATGTTSVTFVDGDLSDAQFNDFVPPVLTASNGTVTIGDCAATPTNTPVVVATDTPTTAPTATPTLVVVATDTPTATPTTGAAGPHIGIGDACGAAGSQVTVMISLTKNGPNIVTVAPLVIGFDVDALSFVSCVAAPPVVPAKSLSPPGTGTPGLLSLLLSGDLSTIPDGDIINCTFAINAAATGTTSVTFVDGDLSDDQFNDYVPPVLTGSNGTVTIGDCAATPTNTPVVVATDTPTTAPTATPTLVIVATDTPTATPTTGAAGPHITIGDATGAAGSQVTVKISLTKNGPNIVTVAPLVIGFDVNALSFVSCVAAPPVVPAKSLSPPGTSVPGQLALLLSGDLSTIPDGEIIDCTFTINAAATGTTSVTFVDGDLSDDQFNDYVPPVLTGSNGTISIGGGGAATPTNTAVSVASDTPTSVPTDTPTPVIVATDTPSPTLTATTGAAGPHITIGDATGAAGSQVTVKISLTKNGPNIVTVAPLVIGFDVNALSFVSCAAAPPVVPAKSLSPPGTSVPGQLALLLSGDLSTIPDGEIIDCTFAINAAATGTTSVTFVDGDLSDDQFNDYVPPVLSGSNGTVAIGGGGAATPTNTAVSVASDTPTAVPTDTPTPVGSTPTPTATTGATGPHITIGNVSGAAGSQVTVQISLTKNGPNIVTVAPLVIGFDVNALSFVSCAAAPPVVPAKSLSPPGTSVPGQLALLLSGGLSTIPDGEIIDCTFAISAAATGTTSVTFVDGDLSDDQFNDYVPPVLSGSNGTVTIQ
jgi:cohesin domain-containing protein